MPWLLQSVASRVSCGSNVLENVFTCAPLLFAFAIDPLGCALRTHLTDIHVSQVPPVFAKVCLCADGCILLVMIANNMEDGFLCFVIENIDGLNGFEFVAVV